MRDQYANFEELRRSESSSVYAIEAWVEERHPSFGIFAPHGGSIEKGTSEIAVAIAGENHVFYSFKGLLTEDAFRLHITSNNFDEPTALRIAANCQTILTIHGCRDSIADRQVLVGGLGRQLRSAIATHLMDAGFAATSRPTIFGGESPNNICNRGHGKAGVQIEIHTAMRLKLLAEQQALNAFVRPIREAISSVASF